MEHYRGSTLLEIDHMIVIVDRSFPKKIETTYLYRAPNPSLRGYFLSELPILPSTLVDQPNKMGATVRKPKGSNINHSHISL